MSQDSLNDHSRSDRQPSSKNPFDYIFFLRPALHPPVWTIVILGYFRGPAHSESPVSLFWLLLLSSAAAGWAFIINQIYDIESDKINNKLYFLPRQIISLKAAYVAATVAAVSTIAGGFILNVRIGALLLIGILLGYLYSGPPLYGKNRPILSALFNGVAHGCLPFAAGFVAAGGGVGPGIIYSLPYFFAVAAVFIGTAIPDIAGDKQSGKITPAVALGIRYATVVMVFALLASILSGLVFLDMPFLIAANLSFPFYIWAVLRPSESHAILAVKFSILSLSLAACWYFWPYAVILLLLLILTRLYYRFRFGMIYPRLT